MKTPKVEKPKKQKLTLIFTTGAEEQVKVHAWNAFETQESCLTVSLYNGEGKKTAVFTNVRWVFKTGMLSN